ncbi:hypothetical protein SSX86_009774 [Deinandra increscens subsp. villosa]|uniref:Uncharacterized protein n=1 Tax=Deinandra increscens subsp. villosa TaxID=3103831 RepID=A0AAP0H3R4_9ASTR
METVSLSGLPSESGAFDFSTWVLNGFKGRIPELAEYIGAVEIKKSEISGRGLVATKNIDFGSLLLVNKAIATERGILPESKAGDLGEKAQMVMWKNFVDKIVESTSNCKKTRCLISMLSDGENEESLEVPDISKFRPESEQDCSFSNEKIDMEVILNILDVNSLVEETFSSKFSGKKGDHHGVGLWVLASFVNRRERRFPLKPERNDRGRPVGEIEVAELVRRKEGGVVAGGHRRSEGVGEEMEVEEEEKE